MKTEDILKMIEGQNHQMDVSKLLINVLCENILNQKYLQAILESQIQIMAKLNDNPDIDVEEQLNTVHDKIMEAADVEVLEAFQQIIRKD
ncbi:hypothetical protein [Maribacter sp. 4G9]|uniref:hypothetical protein n=1 Tax=Maribacter sp. 4G9 TaxID=1889777 RepID=UPI000C144C51|nr:hypothetical protein [Maribacter sp. 4G9]PIB39095.1 hypothetical protein BFP75_01045 [Maribacter sp. 4G9]